MKLISIKKSTKPDKKYMAEFETDANRTKTIHFGAKKNGVPMDDYTITKDKEQRARYLQRHRANENWNNPLTAGSLSKNILWGSSTSIKENIADFKKKFNL
jgi:hypothetical protein